MRSKINYYPQYDYMIQVPELRFDDDGIMFLDFDDIEIEYNTQFLDYNQMLADANVEVRVFNELFLDKAVEFLDIMDLGLYPLLV